MRRSGRQHGYVLIVALALVAITGSVLASVAHHSMTRASEALHAERDVQLRWGHISVRDALLSTAELRLQERQAHAVRTFQAEQLAGRVPRDLNPPRTLRYVIPLGELRFTAVIRDENARTNVNTVYQQRNRSTAAAARVLSFALARGVSGGGMALRPNRDADSRAVQQQAQTPLRAFSSFDQVFAAASPLDVMGARVDDTGLAADLTCWGSGRLNVERASKTALKVVLGRHLRDNQLEEARSRWLAQPTSSFRDIIVSYATPAERQTLMDLTADVSDCYSVWITATAAGEKAGATRHWWAVRQFDDDGHADFEFVW